MTSSYHSKVRSTENMGAPNLRKIENRVLEVNVMPKIYHKEERKLTAENFVRTLKSLVGII